MGHPCKICRWSLQNQEMSPAKSGDILFKFRGNSHSLQNHWMSPAKSEDVLCKLGDVPFKIKGHPL